MFCGEAHAHEAHGHAYQSDGGPLPTCCMEGCVHHREMRGLGLGVFEARHKIVDEADKDLNLLLPLVVMRVERLGILIV